MKKMLCIFFLIIAMISTSALAAPAEIWPGDSGNVSDLITITKPPQDQAATAEQTYLVSGNGKAGTTVTMYYWADGVYKPLLLPDGTPVSCVTSMNTYFYMLAPLQQGTNTLLCYAEHGSSYQIVTFTIYCLNPGLTKTIQDLTVSVYPLQ